MFTKKYRINNPSHPDEKIAQEVLVGESMQYDYSQSEWVAIDTEFLSLDITQDQLCTIQIASPDPENEGMQRVEVIWLWDTAHSDDQSAITELKEKIAELLLREDLLIIMHVSSADLSRLEKFAGVDAKAKVFDTKVAGKIALTNTNNHNMVDLITTLVDPQFTKDKAITGSQWDSHPDSWSDKMVEYAMYDVVYLFSLMNALKRIADRRGRLDLVESSMAMLPGLSKLIRHGYDERVLVY